MISLNVVQQSIDNTIVTSAPLNVYHELYPQVNNLFFSLYYSFHNEKQTSSGSKPKKLSKENVQAMIVITVRKSTDGREYETAYSHQVAKNIGY